MKRIVIRAEVMNKDIKYHELCEDCGEGHLSGCKNHPANIPSFEEAWKVKEAEGYQYGKDALEQVRFGWELRSQFPTNKEQLIQNIIDGANYALREFGDDYEGRLSQLREAIEAYEVSKDRK